MWRPVRLGAFIVLSLIILAIGIFLIGNKQFLFSSTYQLKADFPNVAGLGDGAQVRVGGIAKGTVQQIQLPTRPDGAVTVIMKMERATREVIKKDSVAAIQTEGLLGNKYVEVSFGSDKAEKVQNGDTIKSVPPLDISDLLKKTNEILDATKTATSNLSSISDKINEGKGSIGALVNDDKMYRQLNTATAQAKAGATAFQENMQALKHNWFFRGFFNKRGYEDSTELTKYQIARLPEGTPMKEFVFDSKRLFESPETAKLKSEKALKEAGRFLEQTPFGVAVVTAYAGMKGDSPDNLVLTQARAMIVREYLVRNFRVDDTRMKTLGWGEKADGANGTGAVKIVVYPATSKTLPRLAESQ